VPLHEEAACCHPGVATTCRKNGVSVSVSRQMP
jgi:hypothetical protein